MKKWMCCVLVGILLLCCTACNEEPVLSVDSGADATPLNTTVTQTTTSTTVTTNTAKTTVFKSAMQSITPIATITTKQKQEFFAEPYVFVEERNADSQIAKLDWNAILEKIPSDYYEQYPGQLSAPLTATLYKDGKTINLDIEDPRLVRLLNFYNNCVYHRIHSYTQGEYNMSSYEFYDTNEYRLVLTYTPINSSMEDSFDKQIVCGSTFVGVRTTIPFADYPLSAFGRMPLYAGVSTIEWLPLFNL